MEGVFRSIIYFILIGVFLFIPLLTGLIYRIIPKTKFKVKTLSAIITIILLQLAVISVIYVQPIITYSDNLTEDIIHENAVWARETLEKPWAGFYSQNIPILAYRFHITDLSNDYMRAEVFYFPHGKITVQWNGLYDIIEPLN